MLLKLVAMMTLTLHLLSVYSHFSFLEKSLLLVSMSISIIVGLKSDYLTLMFVTCALVFGAKNMPAMRLLMIYFKTSVVLCLIILFLAIFGFIDNKIVLAETRYNIFGDIVNTRSSFGYVWPTDFATHVFFILMTYWILNNGRLSLFKVVVYLSIFYFILITTDSRLGCGCILLLLLCSFVLNIIGKLNSRGGIPNRRSRLSFLAVLWIPFLAFLSFFATVKYDEGDVFWVAADIILSSRLSIGQDAIVDYGVPLWGQMYKLYGGESDSNMYNYIDSSYLQLLIIYGVVYTIIIIGAFVFLSYKAYRQKNYVILMALFVAGISGAVAQHFIQIFMNPLLLLVFADNDVRDTVEYGSHCCAINSNLGS